MLIRLICRALGLILTIALVAGCTEKGTDNSTPPPVSTSARFKDIQCNLQKPSQVQFTFRMSDGNNHAVVIDQAELPSPFKIFEDDQEIDYTETSYFVHPSTSLELDMVVLLDFTNSMASWQDNGKTGIDLEIEWTRELINQLAATHRMAIMEYHDRNLSAGVIAPFSADKARLNAALDNFINQAVDHGSSRVWDAIYSSISIFDGDAGDSKQRTVFVVTDGKETSSDHTPTEVIDFAKQWQANIFIIGTGNVANESTLIKTTEQTGGEYYAAKEIESFREKLQEIEHDLGGQYKLSYITLKRTGSHKVGVKFDFNDLHGSFDTTLNLGSVYGDDRIGILTFDSPSLAGDQLHFVVRAQHIPRNITRFKFKLDTPKSYTVSLIPAASGGLCEGWDVAAPDGSDYWDISSSSPLQFGDFGPLFEIDIEGVIESALDIPFVMDTTIYGDGKTFTYPGDISYSPGSE